MNVVLVIQARTASTRLPGKVLAEVRGKPLLAHMLDRCRLAREPDAIVVATTYDACDDAIAELCRELRVACHRGHPTDCLDRHQRIALERRADAVVKVPSDCPLIDPRVIDQVIRAFRIHEGRCDYMSNLHPPSWPDGNDVEVVASSALAAASAESADPFDREHTTPFIWSRPARFALANVTWGAGLDLSQRYRWVVDWQEDLLAVREIFAALLPHHGPGFAVEDILELHRQRPELEHINAVHRGYSHLNARPELLQRFGQTRS
jgi:spore coat polysaccharide biosynthesis protein SpsF